MMTTAANIQLTAHHCFERRSSAFCVAIAALLATTGCDGLEHARKTETTSHILSSIASDVDTLAGEYSRVMRPAEFWVSILIVPDLKERMLWKLNTVTGERTSFGSRGTRRVRQGLLGAEATS